MKIIYVSNCCAKDMFDILIKNVTNLQQQAQKYHKLLIEGLAECPCVHVDAVSSIPVGTKHFSGRYMAGGDMTEGEAVYHHLPQINIPIVKSLVNYWNTRRFVLRLCKKNDEDTVVICDILKTVISAGAMAAAHKMNVKCYGIVTDVPQKRAQKGNALIRAYDSLTKRSLGAYDGYVFLTRQMDTLINRKRKPYVIIEGIADIRMGETPNELADKYTKKVCIYAGSIRRIYGIESLVEGFIAANIPDAELHIYGSGDYSDDLASVCKTYPQIRYFGVVPNEQVVKEQLKATLLVNPRPVEGEYTRYSFPSKNMEYMASGTPMLATKLPGIPDEYFDYIYTIDEVSRDGICRALQKTLSHSAEELHQKGMEAKHFVVSNKNNRVQAQRLVEMLYADN